MGGLVGELLMLTVVHGGTSAVPELAALAHDRLKNAGLVIEDPLLDTLDNLFPLKLEPEVLHEHSLPVALPVEVEEECGLDHVLVNEPDRGRQVLLFAQTLLVNRLVLILHASHKAHNGSDVELKAEH